MTIANYTELQSAVTSWLQRTDMASAAINFIRLGESKLNRRLRLAQMETTVDVLTSTTSRLSALPTRFLEPLQIRFDNEVPLPVYAINAIPIVWTAGKPRAVAFGQTIEFDRKSDAVYTARLVYVKAMDIAADTTNWVLTNSPDAYLYSALLAAEPYLINDTRVPMWASMLESAINELAEQDLRSRGQTRMTVDAALSGTTGRTSILNG